MILNHFLRDLVRAESTKLHRAEVEITMGALRRRLRQTMRRIVEHGARIGACHSLVTMGHEEWGKKGDRWKKEEEEGEGEDDVRNKI